MKKQKPIVVLIIMALFIFMITFFVISATKKTDNQDTADISQINEEKTLKELNKFYSRIKVNKLDPVKESVDLDPIDMAEALPDISKYPPQVENATNAFIEIFASTEKATVTNKSDDNDRWLVDMANAFNAKGVSIDGQKVSVRVRGIASGLGVDYISSGKYVPDAFTPSNELWGDSLKAAGVRADLFEKRLVGNVAGVAISKKKNEELVSKYGSVSLETVIKAVNDGVLTMGYTNPLSSSTGINFLISFLYSFDSANPLSDGASEEFAKFQTNIPFVAYTTLQMKDAAQSGTLDGFVFEYQQFVNSPDLRSSYVFTPFGVRHDNPVYSIGELSDLKKKILSEFMKFCKTEENQKLASQYGFNEYDNYSFKVQNVDGQILSNAQRLWKEKKSGNRDVVAVFVADVSGSMDGEPLNRLKQSLLSGSKHINKDFSIGLVTFSDEVNIALPIAKFDINQRSLLTGAVKDMSSGGSTAMFDAIIAAEKMLMDVKSNNPNAKLMMFVLSDGETNVGYDLDDTKELIKKLRVPIYTIGYNADIQALGVISSINEAASINADTDDVIYKIQSLFNAEM